PFPTRRSSDLLVAVANVRTESADVGGHRLALVGLAELARQFEQLERLVKGDLVHLLPWAQAREGRFLLVVPAADLHEGPVTPHAHGDRLAGLRIGAEFARLHRLVAADGLFL